MMYQKNGKKIFIILLTLISVFSLTSCGAKMNNENIEELDELNRNITGELNTYTKEVSNVAIQLEKIYSLSDDEKQELISKVNKEDYLMSSSGILYRKNISDVSAVFVSGHTPVNDSIRSVVYVTEGIDLTFKTIVERYPEIAQVYYNDENSYNRIYPSFDVLTQYQAKMNIPEFNFYYLADFEHNPEKKAVWVKEPYVDPAGRGWMISTIAPVYSGDYLNGVAGIDLTIMKITEKHLQSEDLLMITSDGTVVTISEKISTMLSLPVLKNHKYIETIKSDSYMVDDFNLLKSKNKDVREFAHQIINSEENIMSINIDGVKYRVSKSSIDELDWIIVKIVKE